jgi:hypothetical protein
MDQLYSYTYLIAKDSLVKYIKKTKDDRSEGFIKSKVENC